MVHKVPHGFAGLLSWLRIRLQCRRSQFNSWVGKFSWRRDGLPTPVFLGFAAGSAVKESACNAGDLDLIPGLGRSPGGGHGNSLQCSCLENPHEQRSLVDYGPWIAKSLIQLSDLSTAQHKAHSGCSITGISKRIHVWRERP